MVVGLVGLVTVSAQRAFFFSLLEMLTLDLGSVHAFARKARELLSTSVLSLLVLLWLWVVSQSSVLPSGLDFFILQVLRLLFSVAFILTIYRVLRFLELIIIYWAKIFMRLPILTEYLRDVLPIAVVIVAGLLDLWVVGAVLDTFANFTDSLEALPQSFVGVAILVGLSGVMRDAIASVTLIVDGSIDLGDLVAVRGISGRVVRIGFTAVALRKPGEGVVNVPSGDFMLRPFVNHSSAAATGAKVYVRLPTLAKSSAASSPSPPPSSSPPSSPASPSSPSPSSSLSSRREFGTSQQSLRDKEENYSENLSSETGGARDISRQVASFMRTAPGVSACSVEFVPADCSLGSDDHLESACAGGQVQQQRQQLQEQEQEQNQLSGPVFVSASVKQKQRLRFPTLVVTWQVQLTANASFARAKSDTVLALLDFLQAKGLDPL